MNRLLESDSHILFEGWSAFKEPVMRVYRRRPRGWRIDASKTRKAGDRTIIHNWCTGTKSPCVYGQVYLPKLGLISLGNLAAGHSMDRTRCCYLFIAHIPLPSLEAHDGYAKKNFYHESEEREDVSPSRSPSRIVSTTLGMIVGEFSQVECARYGFSISLLFKWSLGSGRVGRLKISSVRRGRITSLLGNWLVNKAIITSTL